MADEFKNRKPALEFLSDELIERIIDEAKEVLEKVGVFIKSQEGLDLLGDAGARINREKQQAFIPRRLVEDSLKNAPPSVKLYDRNGSLQASLGGGNVHFVPSTTSIHFWDSQTRQHRAPSTQDHIHYAILIDSLEHFSLQSTAFYPADVPKEISSFLRTYICMKYGTKPGWGSVMARRENVDIAIEMLKVLRGSGKALREFLHVDDMARACIHVMDLSLEKYRQVTDPRLSHVNVGTGMDCSIAELGLTMKEVTGFSGRIHFDSSKPDGAPRKLLDSNKIRRLGWRPRYTLRDGLRQTYDWFVDHYDDLSRKG